MDKDHTTTPRTTRPTLYNKCVGYYVASKATTLIVEFIGLATYIITQVIKEILPLSLAENGVIFCYNHLLRGWNYTLQRSQAREYW